MQKARGEKVEQRRKSRQTQSKIFSSAKKGKFGVQVQICETTEW